MENEFRTERANNAAAGIIAVMQTGKWVDRNSMLKRFREAGYDERMSERKVNALIALNTDIRHFSRWEKRGELFGYGYGV
jgi:hypothetical protein